MSIIGEIVDIQDVDDFKKRGDAKWYVMNTETGDLAVSNARLGEEAVVEACQYFDYGLREYPSVWQYTTDGVEVYETRVEAFVAYHCGGTRKAVGFLNEGTTPMQSHEDRNQHEFLNRLHERAATTLKNKESEITAGKDGEEPLAAWKHGGVSVKHLPDDEQGILRISVGGGNHTPVPLNYCVIRGPVGQCVALIEKAAEALKAAP